MFSFLKKLFNFGDKEAVSSDLMERARASALIDQNMHIPASSNITSEDLTSLYHDEQELENMRINQLILEKYDNQINQQQQLQELEQLQQMQDQQHMQDVLDFEQQNNMNNDPFQNPGQDMIVDEYHHNIDHGMDDHHFDHGMDDHHY